ncbi:amino acid adenylation domain-containing protein [Pelagibacterium lacus]|uniref:amino acid adenylation domain-containing protein n=1 Tax=Pelagibacterium lacus TaxID=2282655 RepID=UPI001FE8D22E|nr:amino acid adenylation domain-containing protein [Pelagibacterium lacus]
MKAALRQPGLSGAPSLSDRHKLTEAQEGLWYAQRLDPANPLFNTGHYAELRGPLDRDAFRAAADQMLSEAEALHLKMGQGSDGPYQMLDPARRPRLEVVDFSDQDDPRAAALASIKADIGTAADPASGPLASEKLFVLATGHHLWYRRVHHLAIDGYGMALLNARVAELYNARRTGRAAGPAFPSLAAVLAEDAAYRASDQRRSDAAYWHAALADLPEVTGLAPGRALSAHGFDRAVMGLDAPVLENLQARARAWNLPWPDLLTALTAAYCRRFAGGPEIVVGVPHMGRLGSASARVPAMVMNVLPLRLAASETLPLADFVTAVAKTLVASRRHGRYRSEQMRRDLGLLGGYRRLYGPLINVLPFDVPPLLDGIAVTMETLSTGPVDDITITFRGDGRTALALELDTNPGLYAPREGVAQAARLAEFISRALTASTLEDVPMATAEEARRYTETVNSTVHPVPDTTLAALLDAGLRRTPHAPALIFGGRTWTYADLERRTRALALQIQAQGIGPDAIVAIALPRSPELVIALLAVIRAGAAYLPLDLDHPPERIARILASAQPRLILAASEDALPGSLPVLAPGAWHDEPMASELPSPAAPGDLTYVIYTSGSTGEPKGVMIEHRAIVNRLEWMRQHYGFSAEDRILQKTPATFDVSVWEFFLPFISGGALVVAPPGAHRDPKAIAALVRDNGVTTIHFVPSMLSVFLDAPDAHGLRLRRVFCSGEELPADLGARFHAHVEAELHNLYGPTEAAVDISYWPVRAEAGDRPIPIGFPVWNSRLYVLDDHDRPVPPGMVGHLHLAGVQLARGYLGRPDLTAERFVPDPFRPGERMYRTGDLARWREDGAVVFLGRSDNQVKIRGLRIELGEIEAAAMASGLVGAAAIVMREDRAGQKRLIAYVVPGPHYVEDGLRAYMQGVLPDYMLPAALVTLDALPVSANGKLDRSALPLPRFAETAGRPPATPTERALATLYAELLGLPEPPSAEGDFFNLGGDSLLAVTLMLRIEEMWGADPGLGALFERPDIAGLAQRIDANAPVSDNGLQPLLRLGSGRDTLAPLFVVHPVGGIAWCYRHLAGMLSPRRAVYGLQAPALTPGTALPDSLEALAAGYVDRLLSVSPRGPHHIAGWSVGGIIAQAMAVRLRELGEEVGVVALLDSYPSDCWRVEAEPTPTEALRALLAVAGHVPEEHPDLVTREQIVSFLKAGNSPLGALPGDALDGVIRVVLDVNRLVRGHYHRRYDGPLTHFRAALDHRESGLLPTLWRPYARSIDTVDLPFLHPQMVVPAASAMIARELDARMATGSFLA